MRCDPERHEHVLDGIGRDVVAGSLPGDDGTVTVEVADPIGWQSGPVD